MHFPPRQSEATIAADDADVKELKSPALTDLEQEGPIPQRRARIGPPLAGPTVNEEDSISIEKQVQLEAGNSIKYRTCSWQKTAALLFSEYICLAIMSFPYNYSVLGLVPGLIITIGVAMLVLYTSLVLHEFCLRHPELRDVCDVAQLLYYNHRWAWWGTAVMFLLNNTFIQGLHVLVGAKYLNTVSGHSICTVGFSAVMAVICWLCSLPRTFDTLAKLATLSAFATFISVILAAAFAGAEGLPAGFNPDPSYFNAATQTGGGPPLVSALPTTNKFVPAMNAALGIVYTFVGQITLPSFIAEMKEPRDFPKALWAVTIAEVIVFSLVGGIIYGYVGTQYMTSPAFGSLSNTTYKIVSFSFMIPTLIFLGVLYASVSARFIFFRLFEGTRHKGSHTVVGWASWGAILAVLWAVAFVIAEAIPFFSDLLSLMSSLFDSYFGFVLWASAYLRMRRVDYGPRFITSRGARSIAGAALNIVIILMGLYILTAGTYASVESIVQSSTGVAFTCSNNGL